MEIVATKNGGNNKGGGPSVDQEGELDGRLCNKSTCCTETHATGLKIVGKLHSIIQLST